MFVLSALDWRIFALSACCTTAIIVIIGNSPLSRWFIDLPNVRSLHTSPTPRLGGLAGVCAIIIAIAASEPLGSIKYGLAIALGLASISAIDDHRALNARLRFATHCIAALALVLILFHLFEFNEGAIMQTLNPISASVWAVAIVWSTNLFNFMDGADGLAGGMALIGFYTYALAAFTGTSFSDLSISAASIAGASLGFLLFNFPPARVFMGDAGSIPLGFLAAAFGLYGVSSAVWPAWFPALVFSPFIVDATVTLGRRIVKGEKFWLAHRQHYYQRLILSGWSHRRTVLAYYIAMLACALSALYALRISDPLPILAFWVVAYTALLIYLERRF